MKIASCLLALCLVFAVSGKLTAQQKKAPFSKAELLQRLKPVPGKQVEQGDLAGEIEERGIDFAVDEKVLAEFKQAGARVFVVSAIRQAAEDAARPKSVAPALENAVPTDEKPDPAALKKLPLIEQARHFASEFLEELPNFVVTQIVSRSIRTPSTKDWKNQDKLEIELTYRSDGGEKFKLLKINGKVTSQNFEKIDGATSTGEFGSLIAALFAEQTQAQFKEIRKEDFHGYKTTVYDFTVKKANSVHQITDTTSGRSVITGYAGTIWIDSESARVLRIEQSANDIQRGFPITLAETAIEYDWVTVAGKKLFMPIYSEMILGSDTDRYYSRNITEFRNYKLFDSDMKIILDDVPPK